MNAKDILFRNLFLSTISRFGPKYRNVNRIFIQIRFIKNYAKLQTNTYNLVKLFSKFQKSGLLWSSTPVALAFPLVSAWGQKDPKEEEKKILAEADRLFDEAEYDQLNQLLRSQASWYDTCDVLWRVARCEFHMSKREAPNSKEANELLEEAYRHVTKALELCEECGPAHKVCQEWSIVQTLTFVVSSGQQYY